MTSQASPPAEQTPPPTGWIRHVRRVGLLTFVSRVLGLIRDMGMAAVFGNGPLLDAFTLAFRIPNLSRRLFGEGALTTAFLPRYVEALDQNQKQAHQLASAVLIILTVTLLCLILLMTAGIIMLQTQHFLGQSGDQLLTMTAGLLPYVLFICLSAQLSAMLHAEQQFVIPAVVPILLNLIWILGIWCVVPYLEHSDSQMTAVIISILVGGLLQLLLPLAAVMRQGFQWTLFQNHQYHKARLVFLNMLPILFGLSITQLNAICDSALAWWCSRPEQGNWIEEGTASALYFGQRMYQFPLGIFGVALGTVLFTQLAHHVKSRKEQLVAEDVIQGLRYVLVIGIPSSAGLVILAPYIAETLFQQGRFDRIDSLQTAKMIAAYGTGIWAYLGVILLQRVYYAFNDTYTPVWIGGGTVAVNLALNFPMMMLFRGSGLAYATAIAAFFQVAFLFVKLRQRIPVYWTHSLTSLLIRIFVSTGAMTFFVWIMTQLFPGDYSKLGQIVRLGAMFTLATTVLMVMFHLFQVRELDYILGLRKQPTENSSNSDS